MRLWDFSFGSQMLRLRLSMTTRKALQTSYALRGGVASAFHQSFMRWKPMSRGISFSQTFLQNVTRNMSSFPQREDSVHVLHRVF